jgi:hypothetical protein
MDTSMMIPQSFASHAIHYVMGVLEQPILRVSVANQEQRPQLNMYVTVQMDISIKILWSFASHAILCVRHAIIARARIATPAFHIVK